VLDTHNPQALAGFLAASIALWFIASVAYRAYRGKPLFAQRKPGATFEERWASGRVGTGILARLGTARNCLHVQVDKDTLHIHPHFPFTLGFLPEVYAMDQAVALPNIQDAVILGGRRIKAVEVRFRTTDGDDETLQLLLKGAEGFVGEVLGHKRAA
jgi:hypothetical protein